jgi:hypothetical protein
MSVSQNRYSRTYQHRLPRKNNARLIPGDLEDAGKWYRCRVCGFPCNIDRNRLGGGDGHVNSSFIEGTQIGQNSVLLDFRDIITKAEGDVTRYEPSTNGGCSLCGSLNWK